MASPGNEIKLTAGLINGDIEAFDALYHQYHNAVYANIFKYVQRQDIAEDILQEVFLSLWVNRHGLHKTESVGGWLFVVSHNKSLTFLRKAVSEKKLLAALPQPEAGEEAPDETAFQLQADALQDAINTLPPSKREIFRLCKLQGKTYNEAALLLNISPAMVKESLKSASRLIRNYLSAKYPAIPAIVLLSCKILAG